MLENIGSTCDGCDSVGRRYSTLESARHACPYGWRLPRKNDWVELMRFLAAGESDRTGVQRMLSSSGWEIVWIRCRENPPESWMLCGAETVDHSGDNSARFNLVPNAIADGDVPRQFLSETYGTYWFEPDSGSSQSELFVLGMFDMYGPAPFRLVFDDIYDSYFLGRSDYSSRSKPSVRCIQE